MFCGICSQENTRLKEFRDKKLPIFWIIGAYGTGKSTLCENLAKASKFKIINVYELMQKQRMSGTIRITTKIIIERIKAEMLNTFEDEQGYILDEFPRTVRQAKLFEKHICKSTLIIYVTLSLDALLCREVSRKFEADLNKLRIQYIRRNNNSKRIFHRYENRAIKILSRYPPKETCRKLIETLEDFWGYKFHGID